MQKSIRLVSGLYIKLALLTAAVGFVLRIVLLFNDQTDIAGLLVRRMARNLPVRAP